MEGKQNQVGCHPSATPHKLLVHQFKQSNASTNPVLLRTKENVSSCSDTDHHQSLTRSVIVHLVWPQRVRLWQEYWASLGNIQTESAGFSVLSFSSTPLPLATIMHSFCTGGCCHSINRNVHKNDASWRNWISVLGSLCGNKTTPISRVLAMHFKSTSRQVVLSQIERKIVHSGCACLLRITSRHSCITHQSLQLQQNSMCNNLQQNQSEQSKGLGDEGEGLRFGPDGPRTRTEWTGSCTLVTLDCLAQSD